MIGLVGKLRRLARNRNGSLGFEFAIALPILVTIMLGILQFAMVLHASGAMRNAMGEGLRLAKVDTDATADDVYDETKDELVGVDPDGITELKFTRGTASNGAEYGKLVMKYKLEPMLPFAPIPAINLEETRQIYLQT